MTDDAERMIDRELVQIAKSVLTRVKQYAECRGIKFERPDEFCITSPRVAIRRDASHATYLRPSKTSHYGPTCETRFSLLGAWVTVSVSETGEQEWIVQGQNFTVSYRDGWSEVAMCHDIECAKKFLAVLERELVLDELARLPK